MHEVERVARHLQRGKETVHGVGAMVVTFFLLVEMVAVLVWNRQVEVCNIIGLVGLLPYALGLATPRLRRRIRHSQRGVLGIYTGMFWVAAFNSLAMSMYAKDPYNGTPPDTLTYVSTMLYYIFVAASIALTILEIVYQEPHGNGWIFGVVYTYLTILFPLGLQMYHHYGDDDDNKLVDFYARHPGLGQAIHYNCIHNSFLVSMSFFIISLRDSKVLSEEFCDKVGRFLWTFPSIPLTYLGIWRTSNSGLANQWLLCTSVIAAGIIFAQKKLGMFGSTLPQSSKHKAQELPPPVMSQQPPPPPKEETSKATTTAAAPSSESSKGFFGLVWDDEHLAFHSFDPTPQSTWAKLGVYWALGAALAQPYWERLLSSSVVVFSNNNINYNNIISNMSTTRCVLTMATVAITVRASMVYYRNSNPGDRSLSMLAILVMAVVNGTIETVWFFYFFDLGADWVYAYWPAVRDLVMPAAWSNGSDGIVEATLAFVVGFHTFSIFSALIHAIFWGALVLPKDYDCPRRGGQRTKEDSQRLLFGSIIPMSTMWFVLYFLYDDLLTVIVCHIYADLWIAYSVHLPPPWASVQKTP